MPIPYGISQKIINLYIFLLARITQRDFCFVITCHVSFTTSYRSAGWVSYRGNGFLTLIIYFVLEISLHTWRFLLQFLSKIALKCNFIQKSCSRLSTIRIVHEGFRTTNKNSKKIRFVVRLEYYFQFLPF